MADEFKPVTLTNAYDGRKREATTPSELVRLNADGWVEDAGDAKKRAARETAAATRAAKKTAAPRGARKTATAKTAEGEQAREIKA